MPVATLPAKVTVLVFSLFEPRALSVSTGNAGTAILVECPNSAEVRLEGGNRHVLSAGCRVESADSQQGEFRLWIPGKISRTFRGRLTVHAGTDGRLDAVLETGLEAAVASIVAAELSRDEPAALLEAQAIAARSYLAAAGNRHRLSMSCDTTHCQHMKELPSPSHPAYAAALRTKGEVLVYKGSVVEALYSNSCMGRRTKRRNAELLHASDYPFFEVPCAACRASAAGARTVQLPDHLHGLCQNGARHMAQLGKSGREILAHYYPATSLARF